MAVDAYIGMGSNLGKRQLALRAATEKIGKLRGTVVEAVANYRETEPVGGPAGQGRFINSVVKVRTELGAVELLGEMLRIERELGRERGAGAVVNGPRTIDLDLLLYGDEVISVKGEVAVEVPHPRMHERLFVLGPLAEIGGEAVHPVLGKRVWELLAELQLRNDQKGSA